MRSGVSPKLAKNDRVFDDDAWGFAHEQDLWTFDKLIVARRSGHLCGPAGVPVPRRGWYCVRPCVNVRGMGIGAERRWLAPETSVKKVEPGFFWVEWFDGDHLSVDYDAALRPVRCVRGLRSSYDPLYRWKGWREMDVDIAPTFPHHIHGHYRRGVNCEFIGQKVIEIHLRPSYDPPNVDVVWNEPAAQIDIENGDGFLPAVRTGFNPGE